MRIESVFLGVTPSRFRPYIAALMKSAKMRHPVIYIPAVGAFTLPYVAIEAGYKRENIITSDISLFSTIIGNFVTGGKFEDLLVAANIKDPLFDQLPGEEHARLIFLMKYVQLGGNHYEDMHKTEMLAHASDFIEGITYRLEKMRKRLHGIQYKPADMFDEIEEADNSRMAMFLAPPFSRGDYAKQFDYGEHVEFNVPFTQYDPEADFEPLAKRMDIHRAMVFIYTNREEHYGLTNVALFEESVGDRRYIICNKPKQVKKTYALPARGSKISKLALPQIDDDHEITENSKLEIHITKGEHALYYRNLWVHRLGVTGAEAYGYMTIDGKIFHVFGLLLAPLMAMQSPFIFEGFGIARKTKKYDRLNRLAIYALSCTDMQDWVRANVVPDNNPLFDPIGIRSRSFVRGRKDKSSHGILKLVDKKKLGDGKYTLFYEQKWHDRTWQECLNLWLQEGNSNAPKAKKKKSRGSRGRPTDLARSH